MEPITIDCLTGAVKLGVSCTWGPKQCVLWTRNINKGIRRRDLRVCWWRLKQDSLKRVSTVKCISAVVGPLKMSISYAWGLMSFSEHVVNVEWCSFAFYSLFCKDTFMIQWEKIGNWSKISCHLPHHGSLILISLLSLNHVAFGGLQELHASSFQRSDVTTMYLCEITTHPPLFCELSSDARLRYYAKIYLCVWRSLRHLFKALTCIIEHYKKSDSHPFVLFFWL